MVWPIEIPQFLAWNLKQNLSSELGDLEVEFGILAMGKPNKVGFGWMRNLILPNFKRKFAWFWVRIAKLCPFYRTTFELGFWWCSTDLDEKSGEATTMAKLHGECAAR
jgi:hypothetical protein